MWQDFDNIAAAGGPARCHPTGARPLVSCAPIPVPPARWPERGSVLGAADIVQQTLHRCVGCLSPAPNFLSPSSSTTHRRDQFISRCGATNVTRNWLRYGDAETLCKLYVCLNDEYAQVWCADTLSLSVPVFLLAPQGPAISSHQESTCPAPPNFLHSLSDCDWGPHIEKKS